MLSADPPFFFLTSIQFATCALRENLSNRSSGVQIPRDICTLRSAVGSWIIGTLRIYDGDGEDDAWLKMRFYFTLEFCIYLELFSVSVAIKLAPNRICYESVKFQIGIPKISRCGSRSPDNAEFGHFTLLLCRGQQRNVRKGITHVHSHCFAH